MSMYTEIEAAEIIERIAKEVRGMTFIQVPLWDAFANDIAFVNRFLPSPIKTNVNDYIDNLLQKEAVRFCVSKGTVLYRARKIDRNKIQKDADGKYIGYSEKESGMPPYRSAPYGRVGTSGIPVFYTAMDRKTSCMETRPIKNELINVAEYEVKEDLWIADFSLEKIKVYDNTPEGILFLNKMFRTFSFPVSSELIDYLPSEYIAEYIRTKHREIQGIRYSSLHNVGGYNIALFSQTQCEYKGSQVVECCSVDCAFRNINKKTDEGQQRVQGEEI